MTIWIDPPAWPAHGRLWSHLVSDTSYDELHVFAAAQGIPRRGFEGDHYDVPQERYAALVAAGACPVGGRDLARILRGSGLRIQKRRHERVVSSTLDPPGLPPGSRADVIASRQAEPPAHTVVVRLAVWRLDELLLVDRPGRGLDLPHRALAGVAVPLALQALQEETVGAAVPGTAALAGYVRHTVRQVAGAYPWPLPQASFALYRLSVAAGTAARLGEWVHVNRAAQRLGDRQWWPLLGETAP